MTRYAYDTAFGIYDHEASELSLIALHQKENVVEGCTLHRRLRAFRAMRVGSHYNMSLSEFMELPREWVEFILKDCEQVESSRTVKNPLLDEEK